MNTSITTDKQADAANRITEAQAALDAWDTAHQLESIDPGMQSMHFHESQTKRTKNLNAYLNHLGRETRERNRLEGNLRKAKRDAKLAAQPTAPVDPTSLKGAAAVQVLTRGMAEWHHVIRVNKTTVTCWAPPGFDQPRYPHDRIVGVHHPEESK